MTPREAKQAALVARVAAHLAEQGLAASGLRALAVAAGTSDRMLLYYFKNKDALLEAVFDHIAGQIETALGRAFPAVGSLPPEVLLERLWHESRAPHLRQPLILLLELAAAGARSGGPQARAALKMSEDFQSWIAARLLLQPGQDRRQVAGRLQVTLDGMALQDALRRAAEVPGSKA